MTPVEPVAPVKAPPVVRGAARWFFPTPVSGVHDKLDLSGGAMLLVGDQGRREIIRDGMATDAETLIPDRLIGIIRDEEQHYVFISDEADAYVAREPLGSFEVRKHSFTAESAETWAISSGRSSAYARFVDGRVFRTGDAGTSWKPLAYASTKLFGHVASLDIDREGNGVLIHVPQRVFVTHDDGATWKPFAAPSIGAQHCVDDARGGFLVRGYDNRYTKLEGDALVPTDEVPLDLSTLALPGATRSKRNVEIVKLLAGDHLVELERSRDKNTVRLRSTPLGGEPGSFAPVSQLDTRSALANDVAVWGTSLVMLRADTDSDENTPTSTVLTSGDGGATWKPAVTIEGDQPFYGQRVAAGPKGWTFVPSLCGVFGEQRERNCSPAKVRVAGGATFEDVLYTEEFRPKRFAFDEARDKVYAIGEHESRAGVYESRLGQNKFTRIATPVDITWSDRAQLTVTADGALHVFQYDATKDAVVVERRDAAGKKLPTLYLPKAQIETDMSLRSMSLWGTRGVIMNGKAFGWETDDAGLTWTRVAASGALAPECAEAGCLVGDAQRIGWDLPAMSTAQKVSATSEVPSRRQPDPDPFHRISPAPPPMTITCKASGAESRVASQPAFDNVSERADVYWYVQEESAGKKTLAIGGRGGIRRPTLLDAAPAAPKDIVQHDGSRWLDDGLIAGRYRYREGQPVDVELGIFALEAGRVQHVTLPKLPSFRVAPYGFSGDVALVNGGLLYQPTDASQVFFVHDDGKLERMSVPPHASLTWAERLGGAWMLFGFENGLAKLTWSMTNGASWQDRAWLVTDAGSSATFIRGGGRPWISTNMFEGEAFYPVALPPPEELPNPVMPGTAMDAVCDPHMAFSGSFKVPTHSETVHTTVDLGDKKPAQPFELEERVIHVTGAGAICTTGYVLTREGTQVILAREFAAGGAPKGFFGWAFRPPPDYKGRLVTPLTCTVTP